MPPILSTQQAGSALLDAFSTVPIGRSGTGWVYVQGAPREDVPTQQEYEFQEDIQAGIAYLDEAHPGWEDAVDVDVLDMLDAAKCILGQLGTLSGNPLGGNYWHYMAVHTYDEQWSAARGFTPRDNLWLLDPSVGDRLTQSWQAVIVRKRGEVGRDV